MLRSRNFISVTLADFLVRTAYQMGKTPLLPIYAATLGASDAFLGFIVSVSTLTGMILKPFIGILSDRWGRRLWLIVGTLFFTGMPFLYRFVETPTRLLVIRILHGTATAIYGPVTLAYVAEVTDRRRAEGLGWFGIAREGGYILGPALAGWLMLYLDPVQVFSVIGLMSCLAFVPVFLLSDVSPPETAPRPPLRRQVTAALRAGAATPAIWLAGGLEAGVYVALYAAKTFLPIYALQAGFSVALVGIFFAVQETVHILLKPLGGRVGDQMGYTMAIAAGMAVAGAGMVLLPMATTGGELLGLAMILGLAQALIFPATVALVSLEIAGGHVGAGMGLLGTLQNAGKVAGPILGGLLVGAMGYVPMFRVMGLIMVLGALAVWHFSQRARPRASGDSRSLAG